MDTVQIDSTTDKQKAWEHGRSLRLSGRAAEAVGVLRRGLDCEVDDYRLHDELGMALVALNRQEEAIGSFMTALRLKPDFDEACNKIASAFADRGLHEPAADWFSRARQMNPLETKYLYLYGCSLIALHKRERAAEILDEWMKSKPGNPIARHLAGAALGSRSITKASPEYIRAHFDTFADGFDNNLIRLNYCGPDLIVRALFSSCRCAGERLGYFGRRLWHGIGRPRIEATFSSIGRRRFVLGHVEYCQAAQIYDELIQIDIFDYLRNHPQEFDVVSAADVLTYIGDLTEFFHQTAVALRPGGRVVVAVEALKTDSDFRLNPSGRFSHSQDYLQRAMADSGFAISSSTKT